MPSYASAALESLQSAFQAELEAVQRPGPGPKGEVFKPATAPAQKSAWGGGAASWGQSKAGAMADGKDFLSTLSTAVQKAKTGNAGTPAATKSNKK